VRTVLSKRYEIKETKGIVYGTDAAVLDLAISEMRRARKELDDFVRDFPEFKIMFDPWRWEVPGAVPQVVQRMIDATEIFDVGPMAAVAGALLDEVHDAVFSKEGQVDFLMEDGGEIRIDAGSEFVIGLYAGRSGIGARLGFVIPPRSETFAGVATSSATVGHAISFGNADAVTIFSTNAALADAAATAICNSTQAEDEVEAIQQAIDAAKQYPEIKGVFIARGGHVGSNGLIPRVIKLTGSEQDLVDLVS
jgi:hypothetical protein